MCACDPAIVRTGLRSLAETAFDYRRGTLAPCQYFRNAMVASLLLDSRHTPSCVPCRYVVDPAILRCLCKHPVFQDTGACLPRGEGITG